MFVAPPFVDRLVTVEICSGVLANCVHGEILRILLDVDWKELCFTRLAKTQDGEHDESRRYYALSKVYDPKKVAKTAKEKALESAVMKLHRATHFKFLLQLLDEYARQINPRAVRSSVSVIVSDSASPQQFHSDKANSDLNAWSRAVHSHCFSTLTAVGPDVQTLNYIVDDKARQLQLPPGVAVFLGPEAVHAGSSTSGIRIHCEFDVRGLDAYETDKNCYEKNGTEWPDWKSDSDLERVPWHKEALKVVSVHI